jgi:histidine ammonia-lyase
MSDEIMRLTQDPLSLQVIKRYVLDKPRIMLDPSIKEMVDKSRGLVESVINSDKAIYGINTGFGNFAEVQIERDTVDELQRRLVLSHAAGIGPPMPIGIVRLMLLLKIKALSLGYSGCRFELIERLVDLLNNNIIPVIPLKGSVGASGDLAPLAHLALVLMGEGYAFIITTNTKGQRLWQQSDAQSALKRSGLNPIKFEAKEGLALLNGTQAMTAFAIWTLLQAKNLIKAADIIGAISLEALLGTLTPFDHRIQELRYHPGQKSVAENFRKILANSPIVQSHKQSKHKIQDAYSLRCIPQVHGAVRDALSFVEQILLNEANGVTDNPIVFPENGDILSGGNFHGAPIAYASDFMSIVLTDLASISERRIEHMLDPAVSQLPAFLVEEGGINSGFMIAHVTAASLVSESKVLATPASIDSIPTSANREDHVSMGLHAGRKALQIMQNLENVLAVELICGCQALNFRSPLLPSRVTAGVLDLVRSYIPILKEDRLISKDINLAKKLIRSGKLVAKVENICGVLK